jgi:hypothetical protein
MLEQPRLAHAEVLSNTRRRKPGQGSANDEHRKDENNEATGHDDVRHWGRHELIRAVEPEAYAVMAL